MQQFFYRAKNKILREHKRKTRAATPWQQDVTFKESGSWYEPIIAGPSTFIEDCTSSETVSAVADIISKLEMDEYVRFNLEYYRTGLARFGSKWKYADINTVLYGISKNIRVESYLEIGVRRGRSMAIVASLHPEARITGFDLWLTNYAGIENPGPEFVTAELKKVGYKNDLQLITGNSRNTVPEFFRKNRDAYFDLITVDGDHSKRGAVIDLKNVIPRLKIGGFLIFDDIINPAHSVLKDVWEKQVIKRNRFRTWSFEELGYGIAFAIKQY